MHRHFGDWYREASLKPTAETLEKRWAGIEEFAGEAADRKSRALDSLRLFYDLSASQDSFIDTLAQTFAEHDASFPMRKNRGELRVLSGAAVVHLITEMPAAFGDMLSLGVVSANCQGLRGDLLVPDVLRIARDHLGGRSLRRRPSPGYPGVGTMPKISPGATGDVADEAIQKLAESIRSLHEGVSKAGEWLSVVLELQQEEVDILWWLFGGASRDLGTPFAELDSPAACLIAGKELADLVTVMPGPLAADHMLREMLRNVPDDSVGEASIQVVVNSALKEWRATLVQQGEFEAVRDLVPLHLAVFKSLETKGKADWISAFQTMSGIKTRTKIARLLLSLQMYHERLFMRCISANLES